MVFFTCNACGESLKKGQVEKHRGMCRNCGCLSCIDCGKDFRGDDYKNHLKCISEDQKYGGKAFEAKANKGDVKQQQWLQRIQEIMKKPSISPNIRNILNQMSSYENIPRKKAKFQNWMKNSLKIHNQTIHDQVWEIFAEATSSAPSNQEKQKQPEISVSEDKSEQAPQVVEENGKKKSKRERKEERQKKNKKEKKDLVEEQMETAEKKKSKKRKMEEDEVPSETEVSVEKKKKKKKHHDEDEIDGESQEETSQITEEEGEQQEENGEDESADVDVESNETARGKFNWKGTIKAVLRKAPDNELPIKSLRKKVLAQYYAVSSEQHKSEKDLLIAFNKKIQNNPKFRVLKERVKLLK
ncbi:Ly1 antibody reactive S homeolog [Xenopus laevis]|uniref:Ly1 antibody reactive S homeolog n=1 Tax=Xenopus laevis TaxID=8355 RepID=UPI00003B5854|nr:Ly1 antibody reactive S homeolog [Xenopus laevis]AAH73300.1 MGC80689 protein [Xenopus laevis]